MNRRKPGAMIEDEDEAINRVIRMIKEGKVTSITGKDIDIKGRLSMRSWRWRESIIICGEDP